jgi:hypothetical protein
MNDRFFKHIENEEIVSAYNEGVNSYKRLYEEQIKDGYIDKKTPFIKPSKKESIEQGLAILEENEDYIEVRKVGKEFK